MAKQVASWRKVDVTRAITAASAGGMNVGRVEIENGRIVVIAAKHTATPESELDKWEKQRARKA